jgi:hypothetical protein
MHTKKTPAKIVEIDTIVNKINDLFPLHSMWDGLWVHEFKRKNLVIGASFDRIYYREYDIVFKKVIFFNVPHAWRDTDVHGEHLLRLSTTEEFASHHPNFKTGDKPIFAIDLTFDELHHTFFVVAEKVYLVKLDPALQNYGGAEYKDPFIAEIFPSKKNRVMT